MHAFFSILTALPQSIRGRFAFAGLVLIGVCTAVVMLPQMAVSNEENPQENLPVTEMRIGNKKYTLEVASTSKQAEVGLMYRTILPENSGMLFRFAETRPVAFWMKNTRIPLDMLFIQSGKVVRITHQAQPCQQDPCPTYASGLPVDMVIELPGGTAHKNHIQTGSQIQSTLTSTQNSRLTRKNRGL